VQVCWKKFTCYFKVELKEVKPREGYYVMDLEKVMEMVDENTIYIATILGSTLINKFKDVKMLNDLLTVKNVETGCVMRAFLLPETIVYPRHLQQMR
jgi:glutamate decarboxylase